MSPVACLVPRLLREALSRPPHLLLVRSSKMPRASTRCSTRCNAEQRPLGLLPARARGRMLEVVPSPVLAMLSLLRVAHKRSFPLLLPPVTLMPRASTRCSTRCLKMPLASTRCSTRCKKRPRASTGCSTRCSGPPLPLPTLPSHPLPAGLIAKVLTHPLRRSDAGTHRQATVL